MDFVRLYIKPNDTKFYESKINLDGDAGVDLFFPNMVRVPRGETMLIDFEINSKMVHIFELEDGTLFEDQDGSIYVNTDKGNAYNLKFILKKDEGMNRPEF